MPFYQPTDVLVPDFSDIRHSQGMNGIIPAMMAIAEASPKLEPPVLLAMDETFRRGYEPLNNAGATHTGPFTDREDMKNALEAQTAMRQAHFGKLVTYYEMTGLIPNILSWNKKFSD